MAEVVGEDSTGLETVVDQTDEVGEEPVGELVGRNSDVLEGELKGDLVKVETMVDQVDET